MKRYELLYLLPATLTEEEAPKEAGKITDLLKQQGVEIGQEVDLGKKRLAYPIDKQRYGYYHLVEFTSETEAVQKINEQLRLSRDVVRHMITDKPVKSEAQIEKERALKDRLAARRQQAEKESTAEETTATAEKTGDAASKSEAISAEELDQKLSKILDENPDA